MKGGRKTHLTHYVEGSGTGIISLCGKPLDERPSRSEVMASPTPADCQACLKIAGFVQKSASKHKIETPQERRMRIFTHTVKYIPAGYTQDQKIPAIKQTIELINKLDPLPTKP